MGSRKKKRRKEKRSVASATARRRERAERGYSDMFELPEGTEMFKVESTGIKRIDVIPYTVGENNPNADVGDFYWERTFFAHRNVGVNNEMVICPARTIKQKCPICDYRAKLNADPEADEKTVKALAPSKRMLLNIRGVKKDTDKVKVWHISHWYFGRAVDQALENSYEDHDDNMDNFCDPEDGYYLKCVAEKGYEGQGYNMARVDFVSRKEDLDEDILDQAVCLDEALVIKDYKELKEMFFAGADDEDEDEDEDVNDKEESSKNKKKRKKSKKKKKQKEDEDDDDEDDDNDGENGDDDDDEDDEDESRSKKKKKKKKKKSKKKRKRDEDDDEDDDDGEEPDAEDPNEDDDDDWDDDDWDD
jgi:hypothetical protein